MRNMAIHVSDHDLTIHVGDCLEVLRGIPDSSVDCCVTSPPYWGLRDYGVDGQIGLEQTPEQYVERIVGVFREVRRVLRDSGTLWLNLGDSYAKQPDKGAQRPKNDYQSVAAHSSRAFHGLKPKDLVGIPWMVAFALRADGWYLRSDVIWSKPNPMPESVRDRPTKSHEYVFLLSKSERYFFDQEAVREPFVSTKGSGNGFVRDHRLTFGSRGSEEPRVPPTPDLPEGVMTLDGSDGEAPRGPDGRRKTVRDHSVSGSHPNHKGMGEGRERWPNSGRNIRSVWEINTASFSEAHFATFPEELVRRCVLAGCPEGGMVLDPFGGS